MLRVLWVTNSLNEGRGNSRRGALVAQQRDALLGTGRVDLEVEVIAQERGALDYLGANARVRERWDRGRFRLVHVHHGLTGLATLMLPTSAPLVFTFYDTDITVPLQRTISVATARRARRRIFVSAHLAELWPDPDHVVLPDPAGEREQRGFLPQESIADRLVSIYEEVAQGR